MNTCSRLVFFASIILLGGCSTLHPLALTGVVGPGGSLACTDHQSHGALVVFSRREPTVAADQPRPDESGTPVPDVFKYSDYDILSETGRWIQKVSNRSAADGNRPAQVELAPGTYVVEALARGCGLVRVRVVVGAHQETTLHLDGVSDSAASGDGSVRLPGGQVVGPRFPS